jgi:hypothetical protein
MHAHHPKKPEIESIVKEIYKSTPNTHSHIKMVCSGVAVEIFHPTNGQQGMLNFFRYTTETTGPQLFDLLYVVLRVGTKVVSFLHRVVRGIVELAHVIDQNISRGHVGCEKLLQGFIFTGRGKTVEGVAHPFSIRILLAIDAAVRRILFR